MRGTARSRVARLAGRVGITAALALMLMVALSPEVVGAASAPRLSGHFLVTLTITQDNGSLYNKGDKFTRDWNFVPQCASGGCITKLTITDPDGNLHSTWKPVLKNGKWIYKAKIISTDDCRSVDGTTLVQKNGYNLTEKMVLKPAAGTTTNVTSFTGTYKLNFHATAAAQAKGCPAKGSAKGTFKN